MVVSDDLDELYSLSDRIAVLRDGHVSWSGLANEITYAELVDLVSAGILPTRG
jgi:ABC-type sugar transport system ATPase subunit